MTYCFVLCNLFMHLRSGPAPAGGAASPRRPGARAAGTAPTEWPGRFAQLAPAQWRRGRPVPAQQ
jgi:hypothetical protein